MCKAVARTNQQVKDLVLCTSGLVLCLCNEHGLFNAAVTSKLVLNIFGSQKMFRIVYLNKVYTEFPSPQRPRFWIVAWHAFSIRDECERAVILPNPKQGLTWKGWNTSLGTYRLKY